MGHSKLITKLFPAVGLFSCATSEVLTDSKLISHYTASLFTLLCRPGRIVASYTALTLDLSAIIFRDIKLPARLSLSCIIAEMHTSPILHVR